MYSKKIIIPVAVATIGASAIFGTGAVFAQSTNTPLSGLAQMIAQKFNIDQNQVQSVLDQYSSQKKANRLQKMQQGEDQRLSNLVSQGKITSDQKTAIENELKNLKAKYFSNFQGQTADQRKQAVQNFRTDFQAWLRSQNIDPSIFKPGFMMREKRMGRLSK